MNAWDIGSAVVQKTRPIPIPALNSIANQETRENSGLSSGFPNFKLENLEKIRYTQKISIRKTVRR